MIIIQQGITANITIPLLNYFKPEELKTAIAIEITFGDKKQQIRKLWYNYDRSKSSMSFIKHANTIELSIQAQESIMWKYQVPYQIRIKDKNNNIINSNVSYALIQPSLSTEEF